MAHFKEKLMTRNSLDYIYFFNLGVFCCYFNGDHLYLSVSKEEYKGSVLGPKVNKLSINSYILSHILKIKILERYPYPYTNLI